MKRQQMMKRQKSGKAFVPCRWGFVPFCLSLLFVSCSFIDDDLSDCEVLTETQVKYDVELVTNISTELRTQLELQADVTLAAELHSHLAGIFTDHAHDVDLSFYDVAGDSARLHHEQHVMDASQQSYTLYVPRRQYMHTAVANVEENAEVGIAGDDYCHKACLYQVHTDTVRSHRTGVFTARSMMNMVEGIDQTFNVKLYMANCAAALVINTRQAKVRSVKVCGTGFASGFNIADSTYVFAQQAPVVLAEPVETGKDDELCYCLVSFPSRDASMTRTRHVVETEEFIDNETALMPLWQIHVYVTRADGKTTLSILNIWKSLSAGQAKVIRGWLRSDGGTETDNPDVTTSITLDWKPGLEIEY